MQKIDIHSRGDYSSCALSNFTEHPFVLDGVQCSSIEAFLQALKIKRKDQQVTACLMKPRHAKIAGSSRLSWKENQVLYWMGMPIYRHSDHYLRFLRNAYLKMAEQNPKFVEALLSTGDTELTHRIGHDNPEETILTESEFCCMLKYIRSQYKRSGCG